MPQSSSDTGRLIFLGSLLGLYLGSIMLSIFLARRARKTKWPFKESDRLLRGPGESLRHKIVAFDEAFILEFFAGFVVLLLAWPGAALVSKAIGPSPKGSLLWIVVVLLVVIAVSAWRIVRLWKKRANYFLGWYGERMVAEMLHPLQLQGYRVFHDVPGEPGKKGFNLDHVAVGPTGVAVVEVKSRRKGNARPGLKDHEVVFDGSRLNWPWGYDKDDIQQTINEADWLREWIERCTGLKVPVKPILTVPGWYVKEAPSPSLRVVNPRFLPDVIRGRGESVLTAQQVELIARQLDRVCRDVED